MFKRGGGSKELDCACFCDRLSLPTLLHCAWFCRRWVKTLHIWNAISMSCDWFSLGWGWDTVDMRIWFAYWVMKEGQRVGGGNWHWWMDSPAWQSWWCTSERLLLSLMLHLPHDVTLTDLPWKGSLVSSIFHFLINPSHFTPSKHIHIHMTIRVSFELQNISGNE